MGEFVGPRKHGIKEDQKVKATHSSRDGMFGKRGSKYMNGWTGTITDYDEKEKKFVVKWDARLVQYDGSKVGPDGKVTLISFGKFEKIPDRRRLSPLPPSKTLRDRLADAEDFQT